MQGCILAALILLATAAAAHQGEIATQRQLEASEGVPTAPDRSIPPADRAPEIRVGREDVTIPFVMVAEFPFIAGSVAGTSGKLMLDTGIEAALTINHHRVSLPNRTPMGSGHFGSGQRFTVSLNANISNISIGNLWFAQATNVASQDATQLESITPDFLGWIGYRFWSGSALKLDYRRMRATFTRAAPSRYLLGEHVIAELPFKIRRLPNHPVMSANFAGVPAVVVFDTGQYGALYTDLPTKARLIAKGLLRRSAKSDDLYDLQRLRVGGQLLPGVEAIEVHTNAFPAAAAIGLSESTILSIGYGLLRKFKTVWDYPRRRLYLLKP